MDKRHGKIENALTLREVVRTAGYRTLASGKHQGTENLSGRHDRRMKDKVDGLPFHAGKNQCSEAFTELLPL